MSLKYHMEKNDLKSGTFNICFIPPNINIGFVWAAYTALTNIRLHPKEVHYNIRDFFSFILIIVFLQL